MQIKQKNLRVFHAIVDDEKSFIEFLDKNAPLLREFFLLMEGKISNEILLHVKSLGICAKDISGCTLKLSSVKNFSFQEPKRVQADFEEMKEISKSEKKSKNRKEKIKIFNRPIRSGEEIKEDVSVVVFGRINSGAKLFCDENVTIYGIIDGFVQCDGEFVILKGISSKGVLVFNGEIINRDLVEENELCRLSFDKDGLKADKI